MMIKKQFQDTIVSVRLRDNSGTEFYESKNLIKPKFHEDTELHITLSLLFDGYL